MGPRGRKEKDIYIYIYIQINNSWQLHWDGYHGKRGVGGQDSGGGIYYVHTYTYKTNPPIKIKNICTYIHTYTELLLLAIISQVKKKDVRFHEELVIQSMLWHACIYLLCSLFREGG